MTSPNLPEWVKKEAERFEVEDWFIKEGGDPSPARCFMYGAAAVLERVAPLLSKEQWEKLNGEV